MEQLDSENDKENSADAGQLQRPLYSLLEPAETALVEQLLAQVMPQKKMSTLLSLIEWKIKVHASLQLA